MDFAKSNLIARKCLLVALVAAAYYGLARVGLALALAGAASCPIWPVAGAALVAAIFLGREAGLGVFLGSLLANWHGLPGLASVAAPAAALACVAVAVGNSLQAMAGARFLGDAVADRRGARFTIKAFPLDASFVGVVFEPSRRGTEGARRERALH